MIYLITKPSGKKGYYSFRRLIKEEGIDVMCKKVEEPLPDKDNLPVRIFYGQIFIEKIEIDDRV